MVTDEQGETSRQSLTEEALKRLAERQKQRSRQFFQKLEIKDPATVSDLVLVAGIPQSPDPAEDVPSRKPGRLTGNR